MTNYKNKYLKYKLKYEKLIGGMNVSIPSEQEQNFQETITKLTDTADFPNLDFYINNLIDGGLYWLDSHSSVIDSVFKTSINIIFIQKLGVCSEDIEPIKVFKNLEHNIININNHNKYYGPENGLKIEDDKFRNSGIVLRFNLPNTLINDHIISIGGFADYGVPESGYGVSGLFPITSLQDIINTTLEYENQEIGPPSTLTRLAEDMEKIGNIFENNMIINSEQYGGKFKLSNLCRMLENQQFIGTIFVGSCRNYNIEIQDENSKILMRQISSKADYNINLNILKEEQDTSVNSYWNNEKKQFISTWFNDNSQYLYNKAISNVDYDRKYVFDLNYINSGDKANIDILEIQVGYDFFIKILNEYSLDPITINDYYYYIAYYNNYLGEIDIINFNWFLLNELYEIQL